jgi:hypothetical protein
MSSINNIWSTLPFHQSQKNLENFSSYFFKMPPWVWLDSTKRRRKDGIAFRVLLFKSWMGTWSGGRKRAKIGVGKATWLGRGK